MADILINNAMQEVSNNFISSRSLVDYKSLFGVTLSSYLDTLIRAQQTAGPWAPYVGAVAQCPLYMLSCANQLISCNTNFGGSGSSSTDYCGTIDNPWRNGVILQGGVSVSSADVVAKVLELSTDLNQIYNSGTSGIQPVITTDITLAWTSLKNSYVTEALTDITASWYGVGVAPNTAGAKLGSNTFKVCNTNWKLGAGQTCTWTVPAGATVAKFQVWGAGGGSNPGCCCGGSPGGPTGAYAEATLNVTPGEAYVMCAGCSCNRYCCSSTAPGYGCMSGVTGPGICCLKADGGHCTEGSNRSNMYYLRQLGIDGQPGGACCRYQSFYCTTSGPCWCSQGEYCFDNSCATCGHVAMYPDCCNFTLGCSCARTDRSPIDGLSNTVRGLATGAGCLDTNNYGTHVRAPVISSDTGQMFLEGCFCMNFSSGTCCGGCRAKDWTYHPGHGGAFTHIQGGTNQWYGDAGKAGMIQVSWV